MSDKKLFNKENLKPIATLSIICVIVAALLGLTNMITADTISANEEAKVLESLTKAFPGGSFTEPLAADDSHPETVSAIYADQNGAGHVVTLVTTKGFTGQPIKLTVGIKTGGEITGVVITGYDDSLGKSAMTGAVDNFKGKTPDEVESVELVSGVTYSSKAVRGAVADALIALGYKEPPADTEADVGSTDNGVPVYSIIGILILAAAVGALVAYKVTIRIKRRETK